MPRVVILMAQGFEEMELVITADLLRRAGVEVLLTSIEGSLEPITGSRGIRLLPDQTLQGVAPDSIDLLVLPGGLEGTRRLADSEQVLDLLRQVHRLERPVAAICAAPAVLVKAGIVTNRRVTCHPGAIEHMVGVVFQNHRVVVDGPITTSRAAGTTFEFAFQLIDLLCGKQKVKEVNRGVLALIPDQLPDLMS
ncbi:MAG TPA: DJ-1/PfpI family protein [Candidatus Ozemobacteraceae bacterium]|nr:DJ-1/PfpI family protein [Candidatus Ozemobacteraceae bacterium]